VSLVADYFSKLVEIRSSGHPTNETSYYPAIEALLTEVGKSLKPRVIPTLQLKNRGAGQPDGGLFTKDQLSKDNLNHLHALDFTAQSPNRGVIEVKGPAEKLSDIIKGEQVAKYLKAYGQVLLTNYRDFRLVVKAKDGAPLELEKYSIASSEADFWKAAAHHVKTAAEHGPHLREFLNRALLSATTISTPQHLAGFLASYAREALAKVEARSKLRELDQVRSALEEALGLKFSGDKGEHFFRSTLVQTLFYGLFSAWVLWCREPGRKPSDRFEWKTAVWSMQVPMIRALYERVAVPGQLEPLGLVALLNLAGEILNRVERDAFFQSFEEGTAVQYFYEPFLEAYDPVLRKELGVWYTPREIVRYMVERVDTVLRTELGITSGLADPNVYVLDPGCGTGAYLVEVLERIHRTIREQQGTDALTPQKIKQAARERVFGFEILPAPFVISHLQLGLLLQTYGAPLSAATGKRERVGVYLTNSLTGWEPPDPTKAKLPFPEFQEEKDEADQVKREKPILVVLGNPPYNGFAGVSPAEEQGLVEPYKDGLSETWGIKKYNLDDLYVRFFRLAERRIAEQTGKGIVCYISNFSYLGDPSFVVMRQRFLSEFQHIWIDCMNGDSRETGKLTPDGKPDPSVFSTDSNPAGIRVGTAIGLMVRTAESDCNEVLYRDFWGTKKRTDLLESLDAEPFGSTYLETHPDQENRYSFKPQDVSAEYKSWPLLSELAAEGGSNGLMEKRGGALVDIDCDALETRMRAYFDKALDWDGYRLSHSALAEDCARFDAQKAREKALKGEPFQETRVVRYALRPFDTRWCYYTAIRPVWNEPRPQLWKQLFPGNAFLSTRPSGVASPEGFPVMFTRLLGDNDALRGHAYYFPFLILKGDTQGQSSTAHPAQAVLGLKGNVLDPSAPAFKPANTPTVVPNISPAAHAYIESLGVAATTENAAQLWFHALAIAYSPDYLSEHADGIRGDWPRIPMPGTAPLLLESAKLGELVAALLDGEADVVGVTSGLIQSALKPVARFEKAGAYLCPQTI